MFVQNDYRMSIWGAMIHSLIYVWLLQITHLFYGGFRSRFSIEIEALLLSLLYALVFFLYFGILFKVFRLKLSKASEINAVIILSGIFAGIFVYTLNSLVSAAIEYILPEIYSATIEALAFADDTYPLFIYIIILGPIAEEILARRLIFTGLKNRYGSTIALFFSSFIFAAMHLPLVAQSITALVMGIIFGFLYLKTGSVKACILAHICNNGIALLIGHLSSF